MSEGAADQVAKRQYLVRMQPIAKCQKARCKRALNRDPLAEVASYSSLSSLAAISNSRLDLRLRWRGENFTPRRIAEENSDAGTHVSRVDGGRAYRG